MMRTLTNIFYASLLVVWPIVAFGVWDRLWPDEAAYTALLLIFIVERYVAIIAYFFGYRIDFVRRPNA